MVTIPEALGAVSTGLKVLQDLRAIDRGMSDAEFKLKIATLTESMADVKLAMVELQDQIKEKDAEIARLEAAFRKKTATVESRGYTFEARDGKPIGAPYCSVCIQKGLYYRIEEFPGMMSLCPGCKAKYSRVPTYLYPQDIT